jgi:hypothetical protein
MSLGNSRNAKTCISCFVDQLLEVQLSKCTIPIVLLIFLGLCRAAHATPGSLLVRAPLRHHSVNFRGGDAYSHLIIRVRAAVASQSGL